MKKMVCKRMCLILCFAFLLTPLISGFVQAKTEGIPVTSENEIIIDNANVVLTPENYEKWLNQKLNNSSEEERNDIRAVINAFKKLPPDQQQEFLKFQTDQSLLSEILLTEVKEGESKSFKNGAIKVKVNKKPGQLKENNITASTWAQADYVRDLDFYDIPVFQSTSWVQYSHNWSQIESIGAYNHVTSRNYIFTVSTNWSGSTAWPGPTNQVVYSSANCTFQFFFNGLGAVMGIYTPTVWGDIYNNEGGWATASM